MAPVQFDSQHRKRWRFGPLFRCSVFAVLLASWWATFAAMQVCVISSPERKTSSVDHPLLKEPIPGSRSKKPLDDQPCDREYKRMTASHTQGLSIEVLERSRAYIGNRYRLSMLSQKLANRQQPVSVVACGGSITLGHGLEDGAVYRYSHQLEVWLNKFFPIRSSSSNNNKGEKHRHVVLNKGAHGADMCAMAKRINFLDFPPGFEPDLFLLEFGVNDYQGQDFKLYLNHRTSVFFEGFEDIATCAEVVVYSLLSEYPKAAVVFLEFQTAILSRRTAQLLHMGVAQHYQVPVLSYADALFPEFYRLIDKLQPYNYSIPQSIATTENIAAAAVQPFPHGCAACQLERIDAVFRHGGCKSLCIFMKRSGRHKGPCLEKDPDGKNGHNDGPKPCYLPFFAHDAVHPSALGHKIAADLIADFIAETQRWICRRHQKLDGKDHFSEHMLPTHSGWMVSGPDYGKELRARSNFDLVQDTISMFAKLDRLEPTRHTAGFALVGDRFADRQGWVANTTGGGEVITFEVDLPRLDDCGYELFLSVLRSYDTVGSFAATVTDLSTNHSTPKQVFDCKWALDISIPYDFRVAAVHPKKKFAIPVECTGNCRVTVETQQQHAGRNGNKIKIMSLSARKCSSLS